MVTRGIGLTSLCGGRQVCLLDLDYNLPVQARDSALGVEDEVLPESDVGKEYALQKMQADGTLTADSSFAKARPSAKCACRQSMFSVKWVQMYKYNTVSGWLQVKELRSMQRAFLKLKKGVVSSSSIMHAVCFFQLREL